MGTACLSAAMLLSMPSMSGCVPVPEPMAPTSAERRVGVDLSGTAIGHWSCEETDIVLAKSGSRFVLHELSTDALAWQAKPIERGRLEFKIGFGASLFTYEVPQNPKEPARLSIKLTTIGGKMTVIDQTLLKPTKTKVENILCAPAPLPRFL
ncbi:Hypothetical protein A7982_07470 [Minicystis rosea]|nr:Hypothetical protein A7982_07470 [Minicystis rosea]